MASVPREDVSQLFEETENKTWPGFRRVLLRHKTGELGDVDESTIQQMLALTQRMEEMNGTFPVNEEQFQRLVSDEMPQLTQMR